MEAGEDAKFQNSKHLLFFLLSIVLSLDLSAFLFVSFYSLLYLGVRWSQHGNRLPHLYPWFQSFFLFGPFLLLLLLLNLFAFTLQVLGQLHGRCPGRFHERQPPQWHAHHHPPQEVHGAHAHHLSPGQKAQAGLPSSYGGGRGAG